MKICFVLEGNYPYVRGGVSTWVDEFIRSWPDNEFVLWTISDLESNRGQFVYTLPDNVDRRWCIKGLTKEGVTV